MAKKQKVEYWQLLRDPRWQRLRLEVMQRDEFCCTHCGSKTDTLNVHHTYYEKGNAPWEYPPESLHTLCESCHEELEAANLAFKRQIGRISPSDVYQLLGYAQSIEAGIGGDNDLKFQITTYEHAVGFAEGFDCTLLADEVISLLTGDNEIYVLELERYIAAKRRKESEFGRMNFSESVEFAKIFRLAIDKEMNDTCKQFENKSKATLTL